MVWVGTMKGRNLYAIMAKILHANALAKERVRVEGMQMNSKEITSFFNEGDDPSNDDRRVLDLDMRMARSAGQVDLGQLTDSIIAIDRSLTKVQRVYASSQFAQTIAAVDRLVASNQLAQVMASVDRLVASNKLAQVMASVDRLVASSQFVQYLTLANRGFTAFQSAISQGLRDFSPIEFPTVWIKNNFDERTVQAPILAPRRFRSPRSQAQEVTPKILEVEEAMTKEQLLLDQFDALVTDSGLRRVCRKYFAAGFYSIAVEKAYVYIDNTVSKRSGLSENYGADLMRQVFSPKNATLRLNNLQTISDKNEQTGYMNIFAGAMQGIRNPRTHASEFENQPTEALELLIMANHLMRILKRTGRGNANA